MFERTAVSSSEIKQTPTIAIVLDQISSHPSIISSPMYDIGDRVSGYIKITPRKTTGRPGQGNDLVFTSITALLEGIETSSIQNRYSEKTSKRRFLKLKQFIPQEVYSHLSSINTNTPGLQAFEYGYQYKIKFEFNFPIYLDHNVSCSSKFQLHSRLPPSLGGDEQWGKVGVDMTGTIATVEYMISVSIEKEINGARPDESLKVIARNWRPICFVPSYPAPLVPINRQILSTTNKSNRHFDFNVSFDPVTAAPYFWTETALMKKLGGMFEVKSLGNIRLQIQSLPEIIYGGSSTVLPVKLVFTPSEFTKAKVKLPQITYINASLQIVTVAAVSHQTPLQYSSQDQLENNNTDDTKNAQGSGSSANNGRLTIDTVRLTSSVPGKIEWILDEPAEINCSDLPPGIDEPSIFSTSDLSFQSPYVFPSPQLTPPDGPDFSPSNGPTPSSSAATSLTTPTAISLTTPTATSLTTPTATSLTTPTAPTTSTISTTSAAPSFKSQFSFPLTFPQILPPSYFSCLTSRSYIILLTVKFSTGGDLVLKLPLSVISSKQGKFELALREAAFFRAGNTRTNPDNTTTTGALPSPRVLVTTQRRNRGSMDARMTTPNITTPNITTPNMVTPNITTSDNPTNTPTATTAISPHALHTVKSPEYSERPTEGELDISKLVFTTQQELAMGDLPLRSPVISSLSLNTMPHPMPLTPPENQSGSSSGEANAKGLYLYAPIND